MDGISTQLLVFLVGIFASFIGSQVGSGSSIAIPSLMFLGLSAPSAIAVHRLASVFGGVISTRKYILAKKVHWHLVIPFALIGLAGSVIGANIMLKTNPDLLSQFVGFVILTPLPLLFLKKAGMERRRCSNVIMGSGFMLYFFLSIWTGIFPPGGVTIFMYLIIFFFGCTFIEAKATQTIPSMLSKIVVLAIFIHAGIVVWSYGIPLICGYLIGSHLGASCAIKRGEAWVRGLLAVVVIVLSIKLLFF